MMYKIKHATCYNWDNIILEKFPLRYVILKKSYCRSIEELPEFWLNILISKSMLCIFALKYSVPYHENQ